MHDALDSATLADVQEHVKQRARVYAARNKVRMCAAALTTADISQEALLSLALYCPRMFLEPNVALITVVARAAFCNAVRKHARASGYTVTTRNAKGLGVPGWVTEVQYHKAVRYTEHLMDAVASVDCPQYVRDVTLALINANDYTQWCLRLYGTVRPLTIARIKLYAGVSHKEARDAIRWMRAALKERSM